MFSSTSSVLATLSTNQKGVAYTEGWSQFLVVGWIIHATSKRGGEKKVVCLVDRSLLWLNSLQLTTIVAGPNQTSAQAEAPPTPKYHDTSLLGEVFDKWGNPVFTKRAGGWIVGYHNSLTPCSHNFFEEIL